MSAEQRRLEALRATGLLDSPPDPAFDDLVMLAIRLLKTPIAMVNLVDADRQWTKAAVGLPQGLNLPREHALCPRMIETGEPLIIEDALQDPRFQDNPLVTGEPFLRAYAGVPILDRDQQVLGALCVLDRAPNSLNQDSLDTLHELGRVATRLVEAERRLAEATRTAETLKEKQADIEAFFANAPALMCIGDTEGTFLHMSRAWQQLLGHPHDSLTANSFLDMVHPEDRRETARVMRQLAQGVELLDYVNRYRCADGGYRPIKWFATPSADGKLIYAVAQDITKAQEVERLRRDFVSMVSHELRTPLSSISGTLRLLSAGVVGELPPEAAELVELANRNCGRLTRLANDLLDIERLRSGQLHMEAAPIYVQALFERAMGELQVLATQKGVTLAIEGQTDCSVIGDEDRLVQVLVNLGSNAVRHTPSGGRVRLQCRRDRQSTLLLSVRDDGPGIAQADHQRIFERFTQLRHGGTAAAGGTGLGLAISREIVAGLSGEIGVESAPGAGASFWVRLPRFLDPGDSVSTEALSLPRPRVRLRTDTEDDSRDLLGLLAGAGYDAVLLGVHAQDARTADATLVDLRRHPERESDAWRTPPGDGETLLITASTSRSATPEAPAALQWSKITPTECLLGWLRLRTRRTGRPRVLIVEDDPALSRTLCVAMRAQGFDCTRVADGQEALALVPGFDPDLIVLDVHLPGVDGFRFVTELRRQFITGTPLLVYTGQRLDAFRKDALRLGDTRFLNKARRGVEDVVATAEEMLDFLRPRSG